MGDKTQVLVDFNPPPKQESHSMILELRQSTIIRPAIHDCYPMKPELIGAVNKSSGSKRAAGSLPGAFARFHRPDYAVSKVRRTVEMNTY